MATPTEARTRKELIDPALRRAGWDLSNPDQVRFEIPVGDVDPEARAVRDGSEPYYAQPPVGICDYALYRPDGDIIAVIEAKRTSVEPLLAQAQTELYVREIAKRQAFLPFAFMTNGYCIQFWDVGLPPLSLQERFARIAQHSKGLRAQQREAERQAEHLFQALLHRAFRGEL